MDTHLTTFGASSSLSFHIVKIENAVINQVWSNGCYSSICESNDQEKYSSPSPLKLINGTTKRIIEKNSSSWSTKPIPLCSIILSLVILNFVIILHDFYSSFHCIVSIFKSFLRIVSPIWNAWAAATTTHAKRRRPIEKLRSCTSTRSTVVAGDDGNPSLTDVKGVIEGSFCDLKSCELRQNDEISRLFEEEEPSLKEVKEAFDVFDENKDGFIDARELRNVVLSLGFMDASEVDCRRMIKAFDHNSDGRIDLSDFIKVIETSFL